MYVKGPSIEIGKTFDSAGDHTCSTLANHFEDIMDELKLLHSFCLIITLYREIYDSTSGIVGVIMKFTEVIGMLSYLAMII